MITTTIEKTHLRCKESNLPLYVERILKPPKGKTRISKEKRVFPKPHSPDTLSTRAYVRAYLLMNGLRYVGKLSGYVLNEQPAVVPQPDAEQVPSC